MDYSARHFVFAEIDSALVSTPGVIPPVIPRDVPQDTPREQSYQRRPGSLANGYSLYGSRRSRSSKSSKTRLAVAQLKVKKLEDE